MFKNYVQLIIAILLASNSIVQSVWKTLNTTNSGLPSNKINCIERDSIGTIWIGTDKGLCKYDGQKWTVFNTKNSKIINDTIKKIVIDKKGRKWIHFANDNLVSLNIFNDTTWNIIPLNSEIIKVPNSPDNILYDFSKLKSNDLNILNLMLMSNIGSRIDIGQILKTLDPNTQFNYSIPVTISTGVLQSSLNNIKISSGKIRVSVKQNLPHKTIFKFTFNNVIRNGVKVTDSLVYEPNTSYNYAELLINNCTLDLSNKALNITIDEIIIIPTSTKNLLTTDKIVLGFELFDTQIITTTIKDYSIGNNNNLWVLTNDNLYQQRNNEFIVFNTFNNYFTATDIRKIRFELNGNQWFITNRGLFKYDNTTWELMDANSDINDIIFDKNGINWIYANSGLFRLVNKTKTSISPSNPAIQISNIQDLKIDKMGNKWGLADQTLFQFDNSNWTTYSSFNSPLNSNSASKLLIDTDNNKWIKTDNGISILYGSGISDLCNNVNEKLIDATYNDDCTILLRSLKSDSKYSYTWSYSKFVNSNFVKLPSDKNSIIVKDFGYYVLNIKDSICFINSSTFKLVDTILPSIDICMVTNQNNHNLIVWENIDNDYVSKYRIYKQNQTTSQYELIHDQSKLEMSQWLDTASKTNTNSDEYKICILDICGKETTLSNAHKTIFLSSNLGLNGTVNLSWNPYEGFDYPTFEIWRSMDGNNFTKIGSVANNSYAYIDNNPPATAWYQIRISKQDACNPTKRALTSVNSNIISKDGKSLIINKLTKEKLIVYPNPTKDIVIINNAQGNTLRIIDAQGKEVYNQKVTTSTMELSMKTLGSKGMYVLHIVDANNESVQTKQIVLE